LDWKIKEVNKAKTIIDLTVGGFEEEALCLDTANQFSAADASSYLTDVPRPTEDDVLHLLNLPSFDEVMSEEDAEKLLSYMTVPYLRLPMIISFFATKDRVPLLLNRDIQGILEGVLFEPRRWITALTRPQMKVVPAEQIHLGASRGMLLNEIEFSPVLLLESLLKLGQLASELNTGSYTSSAVRIILFVLRLISRVETFIIHFLDNPTLHQSPLAGPEGESEAQIDRVYLEEIRSKLRRFQVGPLRKIVESWEAQAQEASDLMSSCTFNGHLALLYRGLRDSEFNEKNASALLGHLAFLQTWYNPGLGKNDEAKEEKSKTKTVTLPSGEQVVTVVPVGGDGASTVGASTGETKGAAAPAKKGVEGKSENKADDDDAFADSRPAKDNNKGQNKAEPVEPLEVPDQELFDLLQRKRRGLLTWASNAPADPLDDVLQCKTPYPFRVSFNMIK
jgi:hypothetical protein